MNDNPRNIGKVKFFSALKGYGFLIPHKYDPEIDDYVPKENAGRIIH
jgi:hypothetical protein